MISFLVARWVVGKMNAPSLAHRLQVGTLALLFLLGCEMGVVFFVRQQSLGEYATSRDPVAGTVYSWRWLCSPLLQVCWAGKLCIAVPMSLNVSAFRFRASILR
ncbi:MAG: hypothetical protein R3F19_18145 [Verrucomicrobiales bacterium]